MPLLGAWNETGGSWTSDLYGTLRNVGLLENSVVVRNPRGTSQLFFEHWGARRNLFGPEWVARARGRQVEEQPYYGLATWAATSFRRAIATREPTLETVRVGIQTAQRQTRQRHYDRLILPWQGQGGDMFALSININRPAGRKAS